MTTNKSFCPAPSKNEIFAQIKILKNHKSPGKDGM